MKEPTQGAIAHPFRPDRSIWTVHTGFAALAMTLAGIALLGWIAGLPALTQFIVGRPALSPMTALGLLLGAGAAMCLPKRHAAATWLGLAVLAIGVGIVSAHVVDVIPRLGWPREWWASRFTGMLFGLSGAATVFIARDKVTAGQLLASVVLLVAALMGLGHVFPEADLYTVMPGTGVAIPTVMGFAALSLSQLFACRQSGFMGALASRSAAGRAGRLLLGGGATSILMLAVLAIFSARSGVFDPETAVLLVAWGAITALCVTLWGLAVSVDRAETARRAAERDRDQMRQMVAAAVTHDLRSPLQVASMSAMVLQRLVSEPQAVAAVQRLHRSNQRLDRLLRSLLDALSFDTGRALNLQASRVELSELVADVVAENENTLAGCMTCEGQATGWWDRDALFRVIENLLLNAVKYGEPGAPIRCHVQTIADDRVELTVTNHGPSIDAAEWELIFEPFARGRGAKEGPQLGWGVGLAYARSVAVSHGGTIRVAASADQRTVFELRLPADARPFLT